MRTRRMVLLLIAFTFVFSSFSFAYADNRNTIVYRTVSGSKYHKLGCHYLRQSCIEISLETAVNLGLSPCSGCKPPEPDFAATPEATPRPASIPSTVSTPKPVSTPAPQTNINTYYAPSNYNTSSNGTRYYGSSSTYSGTHSFGTGKTYGSTRGYSYSSSSNDGTLTGTFIFCVLAISIGIYFVKSLSARPKSSAGTTQTTTVNATVSKVTTVAGATKTVNEEIKITRTTKQTYHFEPKPVTVPATKTPYNPKTLSTPADLHDGQTLYYINKASGLIGQTDVVSRDTTVFIIVYNGKEHKIPYEDIGKRMFLSYFDAERVRNNTFSTLPVLKE